MELGDIKPGKILRIYDSTESKDIESQWMKVYCKNKTGFNTKSYKWHIFSGGGYPSLDGDDAQSAYASQVCPNVIVIPNDANTAVLVDAKPTNLNHRDVYVFPENLSWTMAFTHEEGWLGPYFAKHPDYEHLEQKNALYIEKLNQMAVAKRKGWM